MDVRHQQEEIDGSQDLIKTGIGVAAGATLAAPYVARGAGRSPCAGPISRRGPSRQHRRQAVRRQVEQRTSGAVKVNIFPNNVLGGPPSRPSRSARTIEWACDPGQLDK